MSGFIAPNAPAGGKTVSRLVAIGCGFPPRCPYGSSNPPGGKSTNVRLPNGGADVWRNWKSPTGKSYASPYDDRTDMRPSPVTSQATPTRGEKFSHCRFMPDDPEG